MTAYANIIVGANLSGFATAINTQNEAIRTHERGSAVPSVLAAGLVWHSLDPVTLGNLGLTIPEALLIRTISNSWGFLLDPRHAQINAGGTVAMGADLPMRDGAGNRHKITGLKAGTAGDDATRMDQQILRDGSQAFTADQSMGGFRLTNLAAPTDANDAARLADLSSGAFLDSVLLETDGDPQATRNILGFAPRRIIVRVYASLEREDGFNPIGNDVDATYEATFFDNDAGEGFTAGNPVTIGSISVTGGMSPLTVTAERLTGPQKGFALRIVDTNGDHYIARRHGTNGTPGGVVQALVFGDPG